MMEELAHDLRQLLEWLLNGRNPTPDELEELAQQAGLDRPDLPYPARYYARRMQRLLGWKQLPEILDLIWEMLAEEGMDPHTIEQLKQRVGQNIRRCSSWAVRRAAAGPADRSGAREAASRRRT